MWRPPAPGSHASHGPFGELSPLLLTQCQVGADNTTYLVTWVITPLMEVTTSYNPMCDCRGPPCICLIKKGHEQDMHGKDMNGRARKWKGIQQKDK